MPPPVVKTVRDLIFWQYAKIISGSAGFGKTNYRFVMSRFKRLQCGDIFWDEIREYVRESFLHYVLTVLPRFVLREVKSSPTSCMLRRVSYLMFRFLNLILI